MIATSSRDVGLVRKVGPWGLAVAVAGTPLNFRWLGAATLVGVTSMLALIALGSWLEVASLATLIGLSALFYLGGRRASLYPS